MKNVLISNSIIKNFSELQHKFYSVIKYYNYIYTSYNGNLPYIKNFKDLQIEADVFSKPFNDVQTIFKSLQNRKIPNRRIIARLNSIIVGLGRQYMTQLPDPDFLDKFITVITINCNLSMYKNLEYKNFVELMRDMKEIENHWNNFLSAISYFPSIKNAHSNKVYKSVFNMFIYVALSDNSLGNLFSDFTPYFLNKAFYYRDEIFFKLEPNSNYYLIRFINEKLILFLQSIDGIQSKLHLKKHDNSFFKAYCDFSNEIKNFHCRFALSPYIKDEIKVDLDNALSTVPINIAKEYREFYSFAFNFIISYNTVYSAYLYREFNTEMNESEPDYTNYDDKLDLEFIKRFINIWPAFSKGDMGILIRKIFDNTPVLDLFDGNKIREIFNLYTVNNIPEEKLVLKIYKYVKDILVEMLATGIKRFVPNPVKIAKLNDIFYIFQANKIHARQERLEKALNKYLEKDLMKFVYDLAIQILAHYMYNETIPVEGLKFTDKNFKLSKFCLLDQEDIDYVLNQDNIELYETTLLEFSRKYYARW